MTYAQTLNWIHSFKANGRRPDLNRMRELLAQLGNPQLDFPAVHVVGTNGKGSTVSYLQHILTASGYKTGTFTSPFITRFNERIAIDGQPVSDHDLIKLADCVKPVVENGAFLDQFGKPTEFELVTALMFVYFAQQNPIDIAIIEAGIGGSLDSTNVFTAQAVVCPSISFDHEDTLGSTLTDIAKHKAGVMDRGVPVIIGDLPPAARQVFAQRATDLHCPLYELGRDFETFGNSRAFDLISPDLTISDIHLQLLGQHQMANAALAAMTSLILASNFTKITPANIKLGLEKAQWPGRSEFIKPNLMLDGAHNPDAISKLSDLLQNTFPDRRIHILFAGLKRKPLDSMLTQLANFDLTVTTFDFFEARALSDYPDDYPKVADYRDWLKQADNPEDLYVVTGSLYFISEVRKNLLK